MPVQRDDFVEIFRAMSGLPVTIRLIDPPLHEFLPPLEDLAVSVAVAEATGRPDQHDKALLAAVRHMHEENPMLGLRGVRLGLVVPGLFSMQVRAIAEAAVAVKKEGGDPHPEIMVPLVGAVQELETVKHDADQVLRDVAAESGVDVHTLIGTMIEVPRAASSRSARTTSPRWVGDSPATTSRARSSPAIWISVSSGSRHSSRSTATASGGSFRSPYRRAGPPGRT
jgi:pyruvate,orthophosphate dikinase